MTNKHPAATMIELRQVGMAFGKPSGEPLRVLDGIDLSLHKGEILGLLGRSGSGKSTLLRIAGGLIRPSAGQVTYRGLPLEGPAEGIAVVFQTFALLPWLTVQQNVELGLDALGLADDVARNRVQAAIEMIGLDGFQHAYPREISGGMRQRVGFARALVIEPQVLLMDEPFSALDVLTAETLRTDFLDLWSARQLSTRSVLMVTHNIEEAVLMCDRILVLSSHPGRIDAELEVALPHPRSRIDRAFRDVVDEIYEILSARPLASQQGQAQPHLAQVLPRATVAQMDGLARTLAAPPYEGRAELSAVAGALMLPVDELFPIADALHVLEFARLEGATLKLTPAGQVFARAGAQRRRQLFKEHLLQFVPLAAHIRRILDERDGHCVPVERFEDELKRHLTGSDAQRTLQVVGAWSRHAGVFGHDGKRHAFTVANPR